MAALFCVSRMSLWTVPVFLRAPTLRLWDLFFRQTVVCVSFSHMGKYDVFLWRYRGKKNTEWVFPTKGHGIEFAFSDKRTRFFACRMFMCWFALSPAQPLVQIFKVQLLFQVRAQHLVLVLV